MTPRRSAFTVRVLAVVRRIPPGRVATYGDVAAQAGRRLACRAVGNIMRDCREADVPCHRVIAAGGRLGGYGGNLALKRALLQAEGVRVTGSLVRDFRAVRWNGGPRAAGAGRGRTKSARPRIDRKYGADDPPAGSRATIRRGSSV